MFNTRIQTTPLTGRAANDAFPNITGSPWNGDCSFLATLRALLVNRMPEGDAVNLGFSSSSYGLSILNDHTAERMVKAFVGDDYFMMNDSRGQINIHNFCGAPDANKESMRMVNEKFEEVFPGWVRLPKVTDFFHKAFPVSCFINAESKRVAVFVDSLDLRKMHYIQCAIFAFMPWYFDPKDGASEDEMALINSLRKKTADEYMACIVKAAEPLDLRTLLIRNTLRGFEHGYERAQISRLKNDIDNHRRTLDDYQMRIRNVLSEQRELEVKLLGYETKIAQESDEDSEIMEYFLCNKSLQVIDLNGQTLRFACRGYLEYFDEEIAETMIKNHRSLIYSGANDNRLLSTENMEKLMTAIFLDQTLRMKVCAAYEFNLSGYVHGIGGHSYDHEFSDCMPNPHIHAYSCLGTYQEAINEQLINNEYIGAIEQCVASCRSLNFADSAVMEYFMDCLYGRRELNTKCIELPDGTVVDPKGAVEWLNEQEG